MEKSLWSALPPFPAARKSSGDARLSFYTRVTRTARFENFFFLFTTLAVRVAEYPTSFFLFFNGVIKKKNDHVIFIRYLCYCLYYSTENLESDRCIVTHGSTRDTVDRTPILHTFTLQIFYKEKCEPVASRVTSIHGVVLQRYRTRNS